MTDTRWTFIRGEVESIADIDAALSSTTLDHARTGAYVARVALPLFRNLLTAIGTFNQAVIAETVETDSDRLKHALADVSKRLKGGRLAILPRLPQLNEIVADASPEDMLKTPLIVTVDGNGGPALAVMMPEELTDIRSQELADIVNVHRSRAVLAVDGGHFELPSRAHTSHFFRLAECLASTDDLDKLVYWVARDICGQHAIGTTSNQTFGLVVLVDNPSTLVLALRLSHVFPKLAMTYDCVRAYPENPDSSADLRHWLQPRLTADSRIHFIVSVSSTGGLIETLRKVAESLDVPVGTSVLYATTPDPAPKAFCALQIDDYWHKSSSENCEACQQGNSPVFRIDRARYFLAARNVDTRALPPPLFEAQRTFIESYGHIDGVLRTHVNDTSWQSGKHRAFSINVEKLLEIPEFREELLGKIRGMDPAPDLIITPMHPGAAAIGRLLALELPIPVISHGSLRLNLAIETDRSLADAISRSQSILIVDDMAYGPERMQTYVKAIRGSNDHFVAPRLITLMPLLVLPAKESEMDTAIRGIASDHDERAFRVDWLYRFALPDSGERACPWCREARNISQLPLEFDEEEQGGTDERGALLGQMEIGLVRTEWVCLDQGQSAPIFGNDSPLLVAGAAPIQLLFHCASAVQQARTRKPPYINPDGFPKSLVLGARVIRDFQNETLFVICLLRCLTSSEIDDETKTYVRKLIEDIGNAGADSPDLWALRELLLAQMRGLARRIADEAARSSIYHRAGFAAFLVG
ncbi:hypothetical protein [Cupriavidus sp. IK-TO18]|uniref:hypothetical protein n=1 Tax=Cupriavidus sp. IK-TO18 TaxID=2782182 RepID=UPI00189A3ED4|nr:hypothetical protein [Cupriavidus sp. IK-TO18]MBF6990781.1 hypothetical protein [Cupriavidus sp. IK-TO18]